MIANIANRAICIFLYLAGDRKSPDFYRVKAGLSTTQHMCYIGFKVSISRQGLGNQCNKCLHPTPKLNATIYIYITIIL